MNTDDAMRALGILVGAVPGPWNDDVIDVWTEQFERLDDAASLEGAVTTLVTQWTSTYRPSLGEVIEAYHAARNYRVRRLLPSTTHCDGSGWVDRGGQFVPCHRCNPALADVFADQEKHEAWLSGTPLWSLDVGVERKRDGRLRYTSGDPPQCHRAHDGGVLDLPQGKGVAVARAAYEAEVKSLGRKPKWKQAAAVVAEVGPSRPRRARDVAADVAQVVP